MVTGVSGTGKSTVAALLSQRLDRPFCEGDDLHPEANVDLMRAGTPLTDADREPWLAALAGWIRTRDEAGTSTVMACSALRRRYRDVLAAAAPGVRFVHLVGDPDLILTRMRAREHFMPPGLLTSQLATLEPLEPDEPGAAFDVAATPEAIVGQVLDRFGLG